jgi:nucleoside-diphosphate-sugar epimerase
MARILVTGGAGFIGSHVSSALLARGDEVWVISYPDGGEPITGYVYEPWHVRYVGEDVARAMHDTEVATLQEFFGVEASPDYG